MGEVGKDTERIVAELYSRFYESEPVASQMLSSHWGKYSREFVVSSKGGKVRPLTGSGFGNCYRHFNFQTFLDWITIQSYLRRDSERKSILLLMKKALDLSRRMGFKFSYDFFRQVCALNLIMKHVDKSGKLRILNIGDGYGFLSVLIKEIFPGSSICLVDIGRTLLFQAYYCGISHPGCRHSLVIDETFRPSNLNDSDFIYCPAEELHKIEGLKFNLAINIASMQEMTSETVKVYFDFLRRNMSSGNLFYCCNREDKVMAGGEVSRFFLYPWDKQDRILIDEQCAWYKYFVSCRTIGRGPRILNFRVPFVNYFDGIHWQRLAVLRTYQ